MGGIGQIWQSIPWGIGCNHQPIPLVIVCSRLLIPRTVCTGSIPQRNQPTKKHVMPILRRNRATMKPTMSIPWRNRAIMKPGMRNPWRNKTFHDQACRFLEESARLVDSSRNRLVGWLGWVFEESGPCFKRRFLKELVLIPGTILRRESVSGGRLHTSK